MVKYKVNLKFRENGKSLSETVIDVLKIELGKKNNTICNSFKEGAFNYDDCSQVKENSK